MSILKVLTEVNQIAFAVNRENLQVTRLRVDAPFIIDAGNPVSYTHLTLPTILLV